MWGGSSRVVALFPGNWDLTGVVSTVEEVMSRQLSAATGLREIHLERRRFSNVSASTCCAYSRKTSCFSLFVRRPAKYGIHCHVSMSACAPFHTEISKWSLRVLGASRDDFKFMKSLCRLNIHVLCRTSLLNAHRSLSWRLLSLSKWTTLSTRTGSRPCR